MSEKLGLADGCDTYDDVTATLGTSAPQARESLPPGYEVGRYRIARRIGMGGMGVVYEAFDPQLDRRVALREAHSLAVLSHPNVVTVYDAGTMDSSVFIAMEFVVGVARTARA